MNCPEQRQAFEELDEKLLLTLAEIATLEAKIEEIESDISDLKTRRFRELAEAKAAYDQWIACENQP